LEVEELREDDLQDGRVSVGLAAIPGTAVVAVFVAFTKALSEVIVIVALLDIVSRVPIIGVAIGSRRSLGAACREGRSAA
jgi:hypothetical protein